MSVRRIGVTENVRALDTLADVDYCAVFELTPAASGRTALQWARATFEGGPSPLCWLVYTGWRFGLGLRLGPRVDPDHVLGCRIVLAEPDLVILEQRSRLMIAHNVVIRDEATLRWATFVRYDRPVGRPLWSVAAPVHRRLLPFLLARAAARRPVHQR
ncbi:MAG TPA: hypothetical protein VHX38_17295 [Pseudonocardiaceae bacterium]|nr:hypothetical protein [Pseudonocardiaceae bacterium]